MNALSKIMTSALLGMTLSAGCAATQYTLQAKSLNAEYLEKNSNGRKVCIVLSQAESKLTSMLNYHCDNTIEIKKERIEGETAFRNVPISSNTYKEFKRLEAEARGE